MEIILRERIEKLGVRGDVVSVSSGYARNYLLPKKLAVLATPANMKQIEQEKAASVNQERSAVGHAPPIEATDAMP